MQKLDDQDLSRASAKGLFLSRARLVGLKMVWLNDLYGGKLPITLPPGIITGVTALSAAASLPFPKPRAVADGACA